jgi:hypothetical protein
LRDSLCDRLYLQPPLVGTRIDAVLKGMDACVTDIVRDGARPPAPNCNAEALTHCGYSA